MYLNSPTEFRGTIHMPRDKHLLMFCSVSSPKYTGPGSIKPSWLNYFAWLFLNILHFSVLLYPLVLFLHFPLWDFGFKMGKSIYGPALVPALIYFDSGSQWKKIPLGLQKKKNVGVIFYFNSITSTWHVYMHISLGNYPAIHFDINVLGFSVYFRIYNSGISMLV